MTTYDQLVIGVRNGGVFHVDFERESVRLNGKEIMNHLPDDWPIVLDDGENVLEEVERLYAEYRNSMPCKTERGKYFKARSAEEMTAEEMIRGEDREVARAKLEGYICCVKAIGMFPDFPGWFWQSKNDPTLIILKKWVQKGE